MTESQYFWLILVLVLNSTALVLLGLAQHFHTRAAQAVTGALMQIIATNEALYRQITELRERDETPKPPLPSNIVRGDGQ